ncbi:MAG: flagellar FliJ family protein [Pseudomonadota bacterium]|nr:flagellar FliJ family protein [Pseudomonadota bacterium]
MADLNPLIRLRRWQLDEKRRTLAELQGLFERLEDERQRLEQEVQTEQKSAKLSQEGTFAYGDYAKVAVDRHRHLEASLEQVREQIEKATEEVQEAYKALKTYELAQADRTRKTRAATKKRETDTNDEIATQRHIRKMRKAGE